jgi:hypothetical protein
MSTLLRYFIPTAVGLLLGWSSYPAMAEAPAECNGLGGLQIMDYFTTPHNLAILKQQLLLYRCTKYDNDIERVVQEAQAWMRLRAPQVINPTIVLDIDETSLSNWKQMYQDEFPFRAGPACSYKSESCSDKDWKWSEEAPAIRPVLNLYRIAQCIGAAPTCTNVEVYFVSARLEGDKYAPMEICGATAWDPSKKTCDASKYTGDPSKLRTPREWTLENLQKAGFSAADQDHLKMRSREELQLPVSQFKTNKRIEIENLGKTIIVNIGDQESDLVDLHAERAFKLPNPFYFIP